MDVCPEMPVDRATKIHFIFSLLLCLFDYLVGKLESFDATLGLQRELCSNFSLVGGLYGGLFVGAHLRNHDGDFRRIDGQRGGCDCRERACENESLAHSINPQLRDAMAELTCDDHRQALELRDAMPYGMQIEAHEMVYEIKCVRIQ
jgi:hypothetical protein